MEPTDRQAVKKGRFYPSFTTVIILSVLHPSLKKIK